MQFMNITDGCENKKCEFYAVCESDGVSEASCVCPKHCEEGTVSTYSDLTDLLVSVESIVIIIINQPSYIIITKPIKRERQHFCLCYRVRKLYVIPDTSIAGNRGSMWQWRENLQQCVCTARHRVPWEATSPCQAYGIMRWVSSCFICLPLILICFPQTSCLSKSYRYIFILF